MHVVVVVAALIATMSRATADDVQRVTLVVGETVSIEVGRAMGSICDDTTIVRGEMRNQDAGTNVFVVTGLAEGTTLCRAGTNSLDQVPVQLFEITVTPNA